MGTLAKNLLGAKFKLQFPTKKGQINCSPFICNSRKNSASKFKTA